MDLSYKREVSVGSLVILAVVLFIVGTSWLSGRSIAANEDEFWKIQFKTAGNLKASSVVRISGVTVGKVERIQLVDVGKVLVMVTLPDRIVPRVDATAQIVAVGFVGDAAIEFNPGTAGQRLTRDKVIVGSQAGGLTDLAETLGKRADSVLIGAQEIMSEQMADELQATLTALQSTLKAAERTMRVYGDADKGPTGQITKTLASLERLTNRFDSIVEFAGLEKFIDTPRQPYPGTHARAGGHPHRQPGHHDGAAHRDGRPARYRPAQHEPGSWHHREVRHRYRPVHRSQSGIALAQGAAGRSEGASGEDPGHGRDLLTLSP